MSQPVHDIIALLGALGLASASRGQLLPPPLNVVAKTTSYTILPTDPCGTLFTNRGASGAVTFTLPAATAVPAGTYYEFLGIADQNILVASAPADTLNGLNDAAADSLAMSTSMQKIGGHMRVVNDGTAWSAYGDAVGVTFTLAT